MILCPIDSLSSTPFVTYPFANIMWSSSIASSWSNAKTNGCSNHQKFLPLPSPTASRTRKSIFRLPHPSKYLQFVAVVFRYLTKVLGRTQERPGQRCYTQLQYQKGCNRIHSMERIKCKGDSTSSLRCHLCFLTTRIVIEVCDIHRAWLCSGRSNVLLRNLTTLHRPWMLMRNALLVARWGSGAER